MKRMSISLAALAMSATVATATELRIQTLFTPGTILFDELAVMAEHVAAASEGRLTLTLFPTGAITGPGGTIDAMAAGIIEGHFTWPGVWAGIDPGFAAISDLNGAYDSVAQQQMVMAGGGFDLLSEMYGAHDVVPVALFYNGIESLPSRVPLTGIDALQGLRIRLPAGLSSDVFTGLGAAPVQLSLSEAFSALDRGLVDAADGFSLGDNQRQGFYEIVRYSLYPGIHSAPVLDFSLSRSAWDGLPEDLRNLLRREAEAASERMVAARVADDDRAAAELAAAGVELTAWSEADRDAFRARAREVWAGYAARSPAAGRAIELQLRLLGLAQ